MPASGPHTGLWWRARWRSRLLPAALVGLLIAAALIGVWLYVYLFPPPVPLGDRDVDQLVAAAMASATPPPANSALVYQTILPSLVFIQTTGADETGEEGFGVGSGVVVNGNGDILTALHVVVDATEIEVAFADGTLATATVTGADPDNDIAVLQTSQPPEVIVPAVLGSASAMHVGDEAYVVGNPLGLAGSLSAGVISGFERSFTVSKTEQRLQGLIQFDAAVNPGNSGGPLLNRAGQVVGIVTALANPDETNSFSGIGFAVPIRTAVAAAGAPNY
ncbi:MAG: trypsin-like peptidase domain-containing protein [Anaerolineae bacterium]|nr:trypsin-like peptidase domain-containing protein [Anaerolineae bacterium]